MGSMAAAGRLASALETAGVQSIGSRMSVTAVVSSHVGAVVCISSYFAAPAAKTVVIRVVFISYSAASSCW